MRVSSQVALIACSASAIGAPAAYACSPQDYMSPEDWQALSPAQRAENVAHSHDGADAATSPPAAPTTPAADPPATHDAAPQPDQSAGARDAGTPRLEPPPTRAATPVIPKLDGPAHRSPAADESPAERPASTGTPRSERAPSRPTAGSPDTSTATAPRTAAAVGTARTTVVAVEQLERLGAGMRAAERAAASRSADRRAVARERRAAATERRADTAERRAAAAERRADTAPAIETRGDAHASGRTPVRADEAPLTPSPSTEDARRVTAWAALLAVVAGFAALLLRRGRPEAPAAAGVEGVAPTPGPAAAGVVDPVEAELQAMIAEGRRGGADARHSAQEAGTGGESSTATNSA